MECVSELIEIFVPTSLQPSTGVVWELVWKILTIETLKHITHWKTRPTLNIENCVLKRQKFQPKLFNINWIHIQNKTWMNESRYWLCRSKSARFLFINNCRVGSGDVEHYRHCIRNPSIDNRSNCDVVHRRIDNG